MRPAGLLSYRRDDLLACGPAVGVACQQACGASRFLAGRTANWLAVLMAGCQASVMHILLASTPAREVMSGA
jgi:hypothetical protein